MRLGSGPFNHMKCGEFAPSPRPSPPQSRGEGVKAAWSRMVRRVPVKEECVGSNPTAAAGGDNLPGIRCWY